MMNRHKFRKVKRVSWKKLVIGLSAIVLLMLGGTIAIRLRRALDQAPTPQAILVLEGNTDRVRYAAEFAQRYPHLPIWVSGNRRGQARNQAIFQRAGVPAQQVLYDFCAVDTVTNFTCNVEVLMSRRIQHVYLITSDYHMKRSVAIATVVFGSQGIAVTPVSVQSTDHPSESLIRLIRDCIRSAIWVGTGWTGVEQE